MKYVDDIADDLMFVQDENGYGHDGHELITREAAIAQFRTWATEYPIELDAAIVQIEEICQERDVEA